MLKNTCIKLNVEDDLKNMKNEFDQIILPFLTKHKEKFSEKCFHFSYYQKLIAFIMAYSFTDPNEDVN
jgi:N-lysine methyltransferase SETD6